MNTMRKAKTMLLYHMSDTLATGQTLTPGYKKNGDLAEPFVKALGCGTEMFISLLLNAEYVGSVLARYGLKGMPTHEIKWAAEGIFEFVRRREFPQCCGRLRCNYYYDDLALCRKLYYEDWGEAPQEERDRIRLFEVEADGRVEARDMTLFDEAFDELDGHGTADGIRRCMELAAAYYRGGRGKDPVIELLGDGAAVVKRDITDRLR